MDISSELARSTTAYKLSTLRSQETKLSDALKRLSEQVQDLSDTALIDRLQAKADTLSKIAIGGKDKPFEAALNCFISFAKVDPACGPAEIQKWHKLVDQKLSQAQSKCSLNVVFTDVLQQWLETDAKATQPGSSASSIERPRFQDTFEFSGLSFFSSFLEENGVSKTILDSLNEMRRRVAKMEFSEITSYAVHVAMEAMIKKPKTYSLEVRRRLAIELKNKMAEVELAAVYTSSIKYLDDWKWTRPMNEVLQTHLNGKQRFILDIDITTSIFLEVVSARWSSFFYNELKALQHDQSWKKTTILEGVQEGITEDDCQIYCLAKEKSKETIKSGGLEEFLIEEQSLEYASILSSPAGYDSEPDPDAATDDDLLGWSATRNSAMAAQTYKKVFQSISVDMALTKTILPDSNYTIMHADLKDFGASIPHQTFLSVMDFFGFDEQWVRFAKRYLQTPILQPDASVVESTVGAPFGLGFTSLVAELLLVILDIAVMSKTGLSLSRNHDDFWFSSSEQQKVVDTWRILNNFSHGTGLQWNLQKSGSTVVSNASAVLEISSDLPSESLKWGLLILGSDGSWDLNYPALDERIVLAKAELDQSQSVLGKISVYNKNQAFLARNCALPLIVLDEEYVKLAQRGFVYFEQSVTTEASFLEYIRSELKSSFPSLTDLYIPDGFFYWPVDQGGLSLQSQLINALTYKTPLSAQRIVPDDHPEGTASVSRSPFSSRLNETKKEYQKAKSEWESAEMKRAFNNLASHRYDSEAAAWAHAKQSQPPFMSEQAYFYLSVLCDAGWLGEYRYNRRDLSSQDWGMDEAYREFVHGVYGRELAMVMGSPNANAIEIIARSMIPSYALKDLKQTIKKLYS